MFSTPGSRARQQAFVSVLLRRLSRRYIPSPNDGVELFAQRRAGRYMAAQQGPAGRPYELQTHLGSTNNRFTSAQGNITTTSSFGVQNPTATGTATTRNVATGNLLSLSSRVGYVPASAAANINTGWILNGSTAQYLRGSVAGQGGFFFIARFGFASFTGCAGGNRCFVGLSASGLTSGDPSALTDMIGVGFDSGDANFSVMTNDASGTATKTGTGMAIEVNKLYEVRVFCAPNAAAVDVSLERIDDATLFELTVTTDMPTSTTLLVPQVRANTGSSATTGAGIDIIRASVETET